MFRIESPVNQLNSSFIYLFISKHQKSVELIKVKIHFSANKIQVRILYSIGKSVTKPTKCSECAI